MANELIYKDLLLNEISKTIKHISKKEDEIFTSFAVGMCLAFKKMVNEQPIINAKPVVHEYWKDCEDPRFKFCTNCGYVLDKSVAKKYRYCPACGAQMDGVENG